MTSGSSCGCSGASCDEVSSTATGINGDQKNVFAPGGEKEELAVSEGEGAAVRLVDTRSPRSDSSDLR